MYVVQFSTMKLVEYSDPRAFDQRVGRWLVLREAENHFIIGMIPEIIAGWTGASNARPRLFAIEDNGTINAAAMRLGNGNLLITWATPEALDVLINGLAELNCVVTSVFGPGHVSGLCARKIAERTGRAFEVGRAERIFQLARLTYSPPDSGRLEVATVADQGFLLPWVEGFIKEAEYETKRAAEVMQALIASRRMYLWKNPMPVSMAAWVCPTPHGGCINFVYTPEEYRGKGHGTAVVAGLARHLFANGTRFCFILTDPADHRTNHIYQKVGARTLCELLRCTLAPAQTPSRLAAQSSSN